MQRRKLERDLVPEATGHIKKVATIQNRDEQNQASKEDEQNKCSYDDLPQEVQLHCASFLDLSALSMFAFTNHANRNIAQFYINQYRSHVAQLLTCDEKVFYLTNNGKLYVRGKERQGGWKLGATPDQWTEITGLKGQIKHIAAGNAHLLMLMRDGKFYGMGNTEEGQLGICKKNWVDQPQLIKIKEKVKSIAAGKRHSLILSEDGKAYGCGEFAVNNSWEAYSLTRLLQHSKETKNQKVKQIIAGGRSSRALFEDGTLYSCGDNEWGQLAVDSGEPRMNWTMTSLPGRPKQIEICSYYSCVVLEDNSLYLSGCDVFGVCRPDDRGRPFQKWNKIRLEDVKMVAAGETHLLVLFQNGALKYIPSRGFKEQHTPISETIRTMKGLPNDAVIQKMSVTDYAVMLHTQLGMYFCGHICEGLHSMNGFTKIAPCEEKLELDQDAQEEGILTKRL